MNTIPNRFSRWLMIALVSMTGFNSPRAQAQEDWDVTVPRGNTREISFTTEEGTWMSVDISPDSNWVVFDLLGHIYRLPVGGGESGFADPEQRHGHELPSPDFPGWARDRFCIRPGAGKTTSG